jgi:hypothetical protein
VSSDAADRKEGDKEQTGVLDNVSDAILNAFSKVKNSDETFTLMANEATLFEENASILERQYLKCIKSTEGRITCT